MTASLWKYKLVRRTRPAFVAAGLRSALGIGRIEVACAGCRFEVDPCSHLGFKILSRGSYEPGMISVLQTWLPEGGVFADVGANEGFFSVLAARHVGPSGRVLAVEPQQRLAPVIQHNLELNGLANVTLDHHALSDQPGSASFFLAPGSNTGSSGLSRSTRYSVPTQQVELITLQQLLDAADLARVDLMKMDIEGFEYEAVLGSREVFTSHRVRAFALELHETILARRGKAVADITRFLEGAGYRADRRTGHLVYLAPEIAG